MQIRTLAARQGLDWIGTGWRLFTVSPGMWIALILILFLISVALNLVPFIGGLAAQILAPVLSGGMLLAAADAANGRALDLGRLFAPITQEGMRGDVFILALLYVAGYIVAMIAAVVAAVAIFFSSLGPSGIHALLGAATDHSPHLAAFEGPLLIATVFIILISLLLLLTIAVLFYFAIPLVVIGGVPPAQAIAAGLRGMGRNWLPLLVMGAVWIGLAILATLPLLLGWLILAPMTYTAWYASYRDIFVPEERDGTTATGEQKPTALPQ